MVIDGPEARPDAELRAYFCSNSAATQLPGAPGRFRHQVNSAADARHLGGLITESMENEGLLGDNLELIATTSGMYGIRTTRIAGRQGPFHQDWEAATCATFEPEDKPFSVIWAAGAAFELWVAESGESLTIPRGKMVIFRGDWGHCGARHLSSFLRVHVFGRRVGSGLGAPDSVWDWEEY